MFTGIIENLGLLNKISVNGSNRTFWVSSSLSPELKVDQSLAHNGVCLTVEEVLPEQYRVTAIEETLKKTTLGSWKTGDLVNMERCLSVNGRLDGHIVQGHVDTVAICIEKKDLAGSWEYQFKYPEKFAALVIEKGSISLNGISLTVFDVRKKSFRVAIIPYTFNSTNMQNIDKGSEVNIEFDMIGKYVNRMKSV
ncbi:MAG: riboflavin synthase [Flavitalea sp.]